MNKLFIQSARIALSLVGLVLIIATSASTFNTERSASAAYNAQINYQGKLTNSSNVAVADGTYNMEFKLYDALSGGSLLWTETRTGGNKVQVTNGVFSVMLGDVTSFGSLDFNQTLYLSVNIGGTGTPSWDGEMSPRKKIGTVPVAFLASNLKGTGLIDITNTSTQASFNYDGSNKATLAVASNGFTTLTAVGSGAGWNLTGGNVGIGTATTSAKLHVTATTEQLRVGYDAGNFTSFTTSSGGDLTIAPSGNDLAVTGNVDVSGTLTSGTADAFQVNSSGAIAAATGITSSGTINFSGLTASSAVYTDGSKNLTSTAPSSGTIGYWSRTGTTITPATANDVISVTGNTGDIVTIASSATGSANKALNVSQTGATSGTDYGGYFSNTGAATTNVGLYATATGATNNYAAIFQNGSVGIGTATPTANLHVSGASDVGIDIQSTTDGAAGITFTNDNYRNWAAGLFSSLNDHNFAIKDLTANAFRFHIGSTGNVGISSTAADSRLEINDASGNNLRLTYNDADGSAVNYADLLTTSAGALTIQPSGFVANIGGGTSRTALRFLEPSGTGTDYAAIQANANVTTSYTWTLPAADASGCIQSNGSGTLSIGTCGGGGLTVGTTAIASGTAGRILFEGAGNVLQESAGLTWNSTDSSLVLTTSSTTASNKALNVSQTGATSGTDYGGYFSNTGAATTNVGLYATATGATNNYAAIFDAGRVGIGTTTPSTQLEISGTSPDVKITNTSVTKNATISVSNDGLLLNASNYQAAINANLVAGAGLTAGTSNINTATTSYAVYGYNDNSIDATSGASTHYAGYFLNQAARDTGANTVTGVGLYAASTGADVNYAAIFDGGNVGVGDTTPNSLFTVGSGDLFQINTTGQLGVQQAPVSDYLLALSGNSTNDNSRIIDITQTNNAAEDSRAISIVNTASPPTITNAVREIYNTYSSLTPSTSVTGGTGPAELYLYGSNTTVNTGSVTLGDTPNGALNLQTFGNATTTAFSPILNDTDGGNYTIANAYGTYSSIQGSPTLTSLTGGATLESYSGYFSNVASSSGNGSLVNNAYGVYAISSGNLTTTGTTAHYGGYFSTNGSADVNYGIYVNAAGPGAATNYSAILMGGSVGIGTATPGPGVGSGVSFYSGSYGWTIETPRIKLEDTGDIILNHPSATPSIYSSNASAQFTIRGGTNTGSSTGVYIVGTTGGSGGTAWLEANGSGSDFLAVVDAGTGIATTTPDRQLEINSSNGNNLRLTYNDADGSAVNYADLLTTSAGALTIQPSGFVANIGGGTSRTALRFLEPSGTGTDYVGIQANANVTTSYTWTLPAADASGCIQSNGSGTLSIGTCGGALTPWTSDVDADGFDLVDLSNVLFRETTGAPTGTDVGFYRDNSGDLTGNVLTGKTLNLAVNGTDEYNFSSTGLAFNGNNITGLGTNVTAAAGLTITSTSANLAFTTATSGNITFAPASTGSLQLTSGVTNGTTTSSGLSISANSLTTGSAVYVASSTLSSGSLVDLQVSGTAGASSQKVINAVTTGAITGTQTTYGGFFSNTHSGGTSTNIGLYSTASGGTNNYAAIFDAGNVGIGTTTPGQKLAVAGNIDLNVNGSPAIGNYTFGANSITFANTGQISIAAPNALTTVNGGWSSSSASQVALSISGTVTQSSTAAYTGLLIAPTISTQGSGPNYLFDAQGTSSTRVVITTAGSMGVGTTGPDRKLDVLDASNPQLRLTTTDGTVYTDVQNTANAMAVVSGSTFASSSAQQFGLQITPTINQTSTASYRALDVNVTETATTTSGLNRLADFRVSDSSKVSISNNGSITLQNASNLVTPYGGIGDFQNHLVRSEEFDNASWVKTNVTAPTANTQVAPDGSTSAESLATSSSGGDVCQWSGTAASSNTFTFSVWARSTTGTQNFDLRVDAGSTSCATANNVTGTAVTHTATTSWQRFTVTQTFSGATGNVKVRIFPGTTGGSGTVYAWAAQLDQASRPSNYVLTTGGALTNTNRGQVIESNFATASGFTYGGRHVTTLTGAISASSTTVGQLIRVIDNATGTDDTATVRGLEVQSFSGSNINGVNTAVAAFGYTFGVHAATTGQANEAAQPAAVFADLDNGSAPTQGNAIRAYSNDATSADLVSFYHETSTLTGNGLVMNFGNSGGFTGNFISLKKAGTESFHIDDDGSTFVSFTGTGTGNAVCHATNGNTNNDELVDCSTTPSADFSEMYPVAQSVEVGEIVVTGSQMVNTYDALPNNGGVNWGQVKGQITKLEKSTRSYQKNIVGIISDNYADFTSTGYNIREQDNPKSIALKGRVLVKVTNENGPIKAGDYITASDEFEGYGTKATRSGQIVGQALADINFENETTGLIMVFVQVGYQSIGNTIVLDAPSNNGVSLQSGSSNPLTNTASTFVIQQQTSEEQSGEANILQLQTGDANRFMVSSTGATSILSNLNCEADADSCPSVLKVTQADIELMNIDARGTLTLAGTIFIKDDSFAGSVATDENGLAEITFSYNLGTGKPVVQLTAEAQLPVFAQILEFKQDEAGNYTGFVIKTFDLMSSPVRSIVHYNVVGKQAGYITLGEVTVPEEDLSVYSESGDSGEGVGLVIGGDDVAGGQGQDGGDVNTPNTDFTSAGSNDNISSDEGSSSESSPGTDSE